MAQSLYERLPEIHGELKSFEENRPMMVFGAGEFGGEMVELFGDRIIGFIDNSPQKIGQEKEGRKIISFDTYCRCRGTENTLLVVAVGLKNLYDVIKQICAKGGREFLTYQRILGMSEKG